MPDAVEQPIVSVSGLSRDFARRRVVRDISFTVKPREVLGFLGPNGAGKSTTMHMLTGTLAPSAGSIQICGIDLLKHPKPAKLLLGYLPETPPLYQELTVDEYLTLAARLRRMQKSKISKAVTRVKQRCGLDSFGKKLIGNLSKGYQQRVGIAQAIVHQPRLIILDEPTVGLDPLQVREIRTLIRELSDEHSIILSSHILPEVESVCDRVQIIHQGQMIFNGDAASLKAHHQQASLIMGLRNPPELSVLLQISGVKNVEALENGQLRILYDPQNDPTDALTQAAATNQWQLYQLSHETASLEDVFIHLTQTEQPN